MKRVLTALVTAGVLLSIDAGAGHPATAGPDEPAPPLPAASGSLSLTPYDTAHYTDLYANPDGPITGSTYIFNPTANLPTQMAFDFQHMRAMGINTIGFYNLVQMTDADRDALFSSIEANRQKAVVRIEWYDSVTFHFDSGDPTHADATKVLQYYNSDDPTHGYTALLSYLVRRNRLPDIAYFAVNMPVDDGAVAGHFVTAQYPDGRSNPLWAASQAPYAQYLLDGLRGILGGPAAARLYLSVFYGWDQSYPTPSYAGIARPADGYFFNNYSYPIAAPPDENASVSDRLDQPRLQTAMDRLVSQYPTQPKVVEYGLHTVEFNNGVVPAQTAGVMATIAAKRVALTDTTGYYAACSSTGKPCGVRGTLYFAQNLYKEEGNPPALMDWTLDYPASVVEAEDAASTRTYQFGVPVPPADGTSAGASGGRFVALNAPGGAIEFYDLAEASAVQVRYRSDRDTSVLLSVNGGVPRTVRLPAAPAWRTRVVNLYVPLQGAVRILGTDPAAGLAIDRLRALPEYEAEYNGGPGTSVVATPDASNGAALTLPVGRATGLAVDPVRGGSQLLVRYAAAAPVTVRVGTGDTVSDLSLPATGGATTFADRTVAVTTRSGDRLTVWHAAGEPAVTVDYLRVDGQYEAEASGGLYNGVHGVPSGDASEGQLATAFDVPGASVVFTEVMAGRELTFRYRATRDASMTLIWNGQTRRIDFPGTHGALALTTVPVEVPANTTVIVQRNADNAALGLSIDWMRVSG